MWPARGGSRPAQLTFPSPAMNLALSRFGSGPAREVSKTPPQKIGKPSDFARPGRSITPPETSVGVLTSPVSRETRSTRPWFSSARAGGARPIHQPVSDGSDSGAAQVRHASVQTRSPHPGQRLLPFDGFVDKAFHHRKHGNRLGGSCRRCRNTYLRATRTTRVPSIPGAAWT